ncbi:MAG TPA: sulfite exporter TauE/SafE family protein [Saprospiraceae bacterium]|nr:sulfite exporter TauE/SafE family protein [Saprospiraceae bacterium]
MESIKSKYISLVILILKASILGWLLWQFFHAPDWREFAFDEHFWLFVLAGFIAQLIDGTLGMAYGVSCTTFLLHLGVPPALASTSVHTAEVFTTGISGLSHLYLKNVDKKLFIRLVIPGVIGAMLGAFLLSKIFDGNLVKPFISGYLLILGILILIKAFKEPLFKDEIRNVSPLAFSGGLLDAIGGGGWGPIVTSNIIRRGKTPLLTIGTVNTAEFFIAFASTGIFLFFLGMEAWKTLLGLIIGGVIAAPLGAFFVRFIKPRPLMFVVGVMIIVTSLYTILKAIGR